jgi:hypothetical protein
MVLTNLIWRWRKTLDPNTDGQSFEVTHYWRILAKWCMLLLHQICCGFAQWYFPGVILEFSFSNLISRYFVLKDISVYIIFLLLLFFPARFFPLAQFFFFWDFLSLFFGPPLIPSFFLGKLVPTPTHQPPFFLPNHLPPSSYWPPPHPPPFALTSNHSYDILGAGMLWKPKKTQKFLKIP